VACRPLLAFFEDWVRMNRHRADPRGPLAKAFNSFTNQRAALRRFIDDAALRIHNNDSEAALRGVAKGRDAWFAYENETGLRWDTVFRTLIVSALQQKLNPEQYLDEVLRLAPHRCLQRVRELSPRHWRATRAALTPAQRAIIEPPWKAALSQRLFAQQTA
jgi:transposase